MFPEQTSHTDFPTLSFHRAKVNLLNKFIRIVLLVTASHNPRNVLNKSQFVDVLQLSFFNLATFSSFHEE